MKLIEWVKQAKTKISTLDAELIAMKTLGFSDRVGIIMHSDEEYDMSEADKMLEKRAVGIPLAYIMGEKEFFGRVFNVNQNVLIPRPETEQMIYSVLGIVDAEKMENPSIVDVGTGSGCIPITLKLELFKDGILSDIKGVDVSLPALEVARENAEKLRVNIEFFESDLLEKIDTLPDIITANLPYVDLDWDWTSPELKYEPALALYADDGGLKLIKKLIDEASDKKNDDRSRFMVLEADNSQLDDIVAYATSRGFILISKDEFILAFKY